MARRSATKKATATAERPDTEVQENNVSTTTAEAPVEAPEEATTEAPEAHDDEKHEVEVDLTEFSEAVEAAINDTDQRDSSTGELVPALIEPVNAAFRKLEGAKAKNKARAHLNSLMKDAMNNLDMPLARSYMILSDNLSAGTSHVKAERQPADPTDAFVQRMVGLQLAQALAKSAIPEGVDENWKEKANELYTSSEESANEYFEWAQADDDSRGEEPEVPAVVKAAVKLAMGKSAKVGGATRSGGASQPFDGPRRDIAKHILSAFEGLESGEFLLISEIRKHHSEEYGDNPPSAGAISARLFPSSGKCTIEGITPATNEAGRKGATKD
jgi:hypothetical protein